MAIKIEQVFVEGYDKNFSYIIFETESKEACIVDPGGEFDRVVKRVRALDLNVVKVVLTHTHFDHQDKLRECLSIWRVPVLVEAHGVERVSTPCDEVVPLREGSAIVLGDFSLSVLYTPGHIDDALCLNVDAQNASNNIPQVVTGDTLFVEGCGRTTSASVGDLYQSLRRLIELPQETIVYPGHDYGSKPQSTIEHEINTNRFIRAKDLETFKALRLS